MLILPQNNGNNNSNNYKRKYAINFDLSIDKLTQFYSHTHPKKAYKDISKYMKNNGFAHRQWSGYVSKKTMSRRELIQFTINMYNYFPWLINCVNKMDATIVPRTYDLQAIMEIFQQNQTIYLNNTQTFCLNSNNNLEQQDMDIQNKIDKD